MKIYRVFFKQKPDRSTAKSCGSAEIAFEDFPSAVNWAWKTAEEKGWRVAMVAELPTLSVPQHNGQVIKHTWSDEYESDKSNQPH